ncbi:unnamed protein product [Strongylus vulgaris]|uniref:Neurotransmitter-gated ion-channel transmembrane domain-containing protein n=1 Tax=Strongylus vulgaris TaxID=40348 RepID=A0A3P7J7A6_STRVU|nr:unnamed protein product [Strongylus vulgaris]
MARSRSTQRCRMRTLEDHPRSGILQLTPCPAMNPIKNNGALLEVNKSMQKACLELKTISGQIKVMRKRMEEDERDEQAANDWKFAAMVVDRLCLFIFSIFIVVSTCGIMFSSPHLIA